MIDCSDCTKTQKQFYICSSQTERIYEEISWFVFMFAFGWLLKHSTSILVDYVIAVILHLLTVEVIFEFSLAPISMPHSSVLAIYSSGSFLIVNFKLKKWNGPVLGSA